MSARTLDGIAELFDKRVHGAIGLHVNAKRYLCATRPGDHDAQSDDSKRSLVLQGGVFIARPGAADAVRVRIWDDLAKAPAAVTPPLDQFLSRARRIAIR